jgi:hypothetical protein
MPKQKKLVRTTSRNKTKKAVLPQRNTIAEIFIQVGAVAIMAYAVILALYSLIVLAFNDTGSAMAGPIAFLMFLFCINFAIQGVKLFRESNRVDHYTYRIIAICLILLLPLVVIMSQVVTSSLSMLAAKSIEDTTSIAHALNAIMIVSAILGVLGSIWLWILAADKNKLVWILETNNSKSREYNQTKERMAKNKKLGFMFLLAPVALLVVYLFTTILIGSIGNAGAPFWFLSILLQQVLFCLWLPSIIVGVVILAKRK